jgi:hypothetical protein
MLLVGQPTPSSWVDDVIGEAGFWKAVWLERSVGRMMVYPTAPIAECLAKGPNTWGQRRFYEEEKIRGVVVQHRIDVDQGRAVGPRLMNVYGEEFELHGRRGGGRRVVGCRGPSSPGRCGGVSPSAVGVCPSGPSLGQVKRCSTKPGPGWPGHGGDGEPGGECGKGNGALIGGSWRILCEESLF